MSGGQQAENTLHENSIGWAIMLVIFAVLVWIFWYYFAAEVRNLVRYIRFAEMWILQYFIYAYETIFLGGTDYQVYFGRNVFSWWDAFNQTLLTSKENLSYQHLSLYSTLTMEPMKIAFSSLMGGFALWCMFKGPNTQFREKMGLERFISRQSEIFPVISPFKDFNPSTQPPRPPGSPVPAELPMFAEALGPEEWLAYNEVVAAGGELREDLLYKSFQKQLGPRWKGVNALKPAQQILMAAFCLKAARKRSESDDMLGRLAMCWNHQTGLKLGQDKTLLKEARAVLKNKGLCGETLAKVNQHAYETTAILRALQTAREEGGVLQSAQFVWLRAHNRRLWYPLNNLGRQSLHMEALGAMSHYSMEKRTLRPIPIPKLEDAITTITEYMASPSKRPIPQLDYSRSKKRGIKKAV